MLHKGSDREFLGFSHPPHVGAIVRCGFFAVGAIPEVLYFQIKDDWTTVGAFGFVSSHVFFLRFDQGSRSGVTTDKEEKEMVTQCRRCRSNPTMADRNDGERGEEAFPRADYIRIASCSLHSQSPMPACVICCMRGPDCLARLHHLHAIARWTDISSLD